MGRSLLNPRWKNKPDVYLQPITHSRGSQVPSLVWFCLQCISEFPDQIQLPLKLIYRPTTFGFIDSLVGATADDWYSTRGLELDLSKLDPRLWAAVIQVFDHLPAHLRTYTLPLNDELLPLIQGLKNTDNFSLLTILELPGCDALTDDTIAELKCLHKLVAFDASHTGISSNGIVTLARTLLVNEAGENMRMLRGPWGLRILRVKHCVAIDNTVYDILSSFPLLSVVDLRGTGCRPPAPSSKMTFLPCKERIFFSSDLASSLAALQLHHLDTQMHSAPRNFQFILRIKGLCHQRIAYTLDKQPHIGSTHLQKQESDDWIRRGNTEQGYIHSRSSQLLPDSEFYSHWAIQENYRDMRPQKRFRTSIPARGNPNETSPTNDLNVAEGEGSTEHYGGVFRRRGLHWYDADRQRQSTYVPISRTKSDFSEELMMYRPMQPWNCLEKELVKLLEKEAQKGQKGTKKTLTGPLSIIPKASKTGLQAQDELQSMTTLALRRRQSETAQATHGSHQTTLNSPLSRQTMGSYTPQPGKSQLPLATQKPLKPISMLKTPNFTRDLLERNIAKTPKVPIFGVQDKNPVASTSESVKDKITTLEPTTWSTGHTGFARNRGKEHLQGWGTPLTVSCSISPGTATTNFSRTPRPRKSKEGEGESKKVGERRFDWEAWTWKKS